MKQHLKLIFANCLMAATLLNAAGAYANEPPVANAGPDQTVNELDVVILDGTASFDPDGDVLGARWQQVVGTPIEFDSSDLFRPRFTAPTISTQSETLTFVIQVNDGLLTASSAVNITVQNVNLRPVAEAGSDQTVRDGSTVMLDGSHSFDPDSDPLRYRWEQVGGTPVSLSDSSAAQPIFIAPRVDPKGATLEFVLHVDDGLSEAKDTVTVFVELGNHPPIANAGPDQTVNQATVVQLDGTLSSDPDNDKLSFFWTQMAGPAITLSDPQSSAPTFTAPVVGAGGAMLTFQLGVSDGLAKNLPSVDPVGKEPQDDNRVHITVMNSNDPPACKLGQADPPLLWPPNHKLIPVGIVGVTDPQNDRLLITILRVSQDEATNTLGDGDTSPDAVIQGDMLLIRAERSGTGNGRVYKIEFLADDGQGGQCTGFVGVSVPPNMKPGNSAVDDGQLYDSTVP